MRLIIADLYDDILEPAQDVGLRERSIDKTTQLYMEYNFYFFFKDSDSFEGVHLHGHPPIPCAFVHPQSGNPCSDYLVIYLTHDAASELADISDVGDNDFHGVFIR